MFLSPFGGGLSLDENSVVTTASFLDAATSSLALSVRQNGGGKSDKKLIINRSFGQLAVGACTHTQAVQSVHGLLEPQRTMIIL